EFAMVSVRWTRIEQLVAENKPGSRLASGLIENLPDSLAATQLGITLTSLALGWLGEPAVGRAIEPFFDGLPQPRRATFADAASLGVALLCLTCLHLGLGELVPRAIALRHAERIVLLFAAPLRAFRAVTRPLVVFMRRSVDLVVRILRVPPPPVSSQVHSPD